MINVKANFRLSFAGGTPEPVSPSTIYDTHASAPQGPNGPESRH